jgi:hypothetical protein
VWSATAPAPTPGQRRCHDPRQRQRGSMHAMMVITGGGGNGASFQYRSTTNARRATPTSPRRLHLRTGQDRTARRQLQRLRLRGREDLERCRPDADCDDRSVLDRHLRHLAEAGVDRTYQFEASPPPQRDGAWQGAIINAPVYNDAAPIVSDGTDSTASRDRPPVTQRSLRPTDSLTIR